MSSSHISTATTCITPLLLLLIITYLPSPAITQPNLPITPTIAECGPRILPLAMCAPFVQGVSTTPTQSCCDSLGHINQQQPRCLCILLNNSALSSAFPVNTTLAMELPHICSVDFDIVSCTGAPLPSISPTPQVSLGSATNTTVASSPMASVTPKSGFMGLGFHPSNGMRSKESSQLWISALLVIFTYVSTSTLY
uniref:non-specific lipid transfer protein GPI-anchored 10 n=1 Tax=Erigeron canadensis TaxID=72917 RepID=UPI001CB98BE3|nr:non-specific lipid transfer protein GPI-anchored 10 [Erigeron canadensis]